jgi:tRNA-dihydrouridine synthase 3
MFLSVVWFQVRTAFFEGRNRADSIVSDIYDWGASAITVHGRSRQQRYSKLADFGAIFTSVHRRPLINCMSLERRERSR